MTELNAELAYRVLDHIDDWPEQHNQLVWFERTKCGTAGCFAGWTCLLAGDKPKFEADDSLWDVETCTVDTSNGHQEIPTRAAELLGIDYKPSAGWRSGRPDADRLFSIQNSREDLHQLVLEIFGPRPASMPAAPR